jgi:hypothetical protein
VKLGKQKLNLDIDQITNMTSVDIYNSLKSDIKAVETGFPTFEAKPNEQDYTIGFIYRYFVRKRNEPIGVISEISKELYDKFTSSPFYLPLKMRWKITGTNKFEVEQLNQRSINYAQETMGNIDTYVKNLTKFYRG